MLLRHCKQVFYSLLMLGIGLGCGAAANAQAVLSPAGNASVQDGLSADANFGGAATLAVSNNTAASNHRGSYLRFDLSALSGTVARATLRLYGFHTGAFPTSLDSAYGVTDDSWAENTITWNTKPALGPRQSSTSVSTAPGYYEWDVTAFVAAQKSTGRNVMSLAVALDSPSDALDLFNSQEAAANPPQLVVTTGSGFNVLGFHNDRRRLGWNNAETILTPANVAGPSFGLRWNSPQLDVVGPYAPHLYASPLYVDSVTLSGGTYSGGTFGVVYAATSNGYAYAVNAFSTGSVPAGTILWRAKLTKPLVCRLDGGMQLGVLSTPVIDLAATPPRMYVASLDAVSGWQIFALDITSGKALPGWPLTLSNANLSPIVQNGPAKFEAATSMAQRGALNLSPDGSRLYIPFGGYFDSAAGWLVAINTGTNASGTSAGTPSLASAFAAGATSGTANGGMWAAGGAAVDLLGNVFVTTGNSPAGSDNTPGDWGQSLLEWGPSLPLTLTGTYTPFNYTSMDVSDIDLCGSAPVVLPDFSPASTSTPSLLTTGGKQGNVYLIDRLHMPGSLTQRPAPDLPSSTDGSLLPPGPQPQFGAQGPLNVFGLYSEADANWDYAKSRATPAYFLGADGTSYLFHVGSSKLGAGDPSLPPGTPSWTTVPPCVARLKVVLSPGQPAYLALDQFETTLKFDTPGSPMISSNGPSNAVLWVLVANVGRSQSLLLGSTPHPTLYALDAQSLAVLYTSPVGTLSVGGKYNTPAIARGMVFVGTDRIQAFGLLPPLSKNYIAINSGGGATGNFLADCYVAGGHADSITGSVNTRGVTNPAPTPVYLTKRTGNGPGLGFLYTIPTLTPGAAYTVRLHFLENVKTASVQRQFNVAINGVTVLTNFDIFASAGGQMKAVVKQFPAVGDGNGQITIAYTCGAASVPLACGIELTQSP